MPMPTLKDPARLTVLVDEKTKQALERLADADGRSVGGLTRQLLARAIAEREHRNQAAA